MASSGESLPLGASGQTLTGGVPQEPPAVRRKRGETSLSVAARLLAGASTFFFLAFAFAYFYLRSLNVEHMWKPAHVKPEQGLGAAFIACIIISAALAIVSGQRDRSKSSWTATGAGAVLFGLIAVALQCIEFTAQKFGPTDGAYASVFCTWLSFYMIAVLATMYWLEIQVATEWRERRHPVDRGLEGTVVYEHPDRLLPRGLGAAVFYWSYLAGIGVITYVVLYLV